jgi:hypothetical protein
VQAAGTSERNQGKVPRIMAALNRDVTQRPFHVGGHNIQNTLRRCHARYLSFCRPCHVRCQLIESLARAIFIKSEFTAQKGRARKVAKHDVSIGYCRQKRSSITGWTGIGAGRLRPDAQRAAFIDLCDRPATRADCGLIIGIATGTPATIDSFVDRMRHRTLPRQSMSAPSED